MNAAPPIAPMLATPTSSLPRDGDRWAYELKWDGYRTIATVVDGALRLTSRRGLDVTSTYPELAGLIDALRGFDAVLDGELVVLDDEGRPRFEALQQHRSNAALMCFDLLALDGHELTQRPWRERRALLERLALSGAAWQTPPAVIGDPDAVLATARQLGLEGVVAKRVDAPYRAGRRSSEWQKLKLTCEQELVVGGWLPGEGRLVTTMGALLVGYYDSPPKSPVSGKLRYAGRVGSGLSDGQRDGLVAQLTRRPTSPFDSQPRLANAVWVEPRCVVQIRFTEWTRDGLLRQPVFFGIRDDKDPLEVGRET